MSYTAHQKKKKMTVNDKVKELACLLKQAKKDKKPQPVFFLGAGSSHTNLPSENTILEHIAENKEYRKWPSVKTPVSKLRTYAELMNGLPPAVKDKLLKEFIDKAKINDTHIYLAQLMKEGFVDYILTVNSDNLILRALALYNLFPATYDMIRTF